MRTAAALADVSPSVEVAVICSILLLVVIVAAIVWSVWLKPRVMRLSADDDAPASPFTMDHLEKMKETGQITDEEFRILRGKLLGAMDAMPAKPGAGESSSSRPTPPASDGQGADGEDETDKESE